MKKLILVLALAAASSNYAQIHVKDNQTFNLAVGNDGLEIETSRNLYVRASLCTDKIYGGIGLNLSSDQFDTIISHAGVRLGKKFGEPAGIFGVEFGVDVKLNDNFFVGARVFSDWTANNKGTINELGYGLRVGVFL
jgi:hypothetical protein